MHNNENNHTNGKFEIEERRREVSLLAQSMTENEILAKSDVALLIYHVQWTSF